MYSKIILVSTCAVLLGATIQSEGKPSVSFFDVRDLPEPKENELTSSVLWKTENMVSHGIRLSPGAKIDEHHHPVFDESLIVFSGRLSLWLDGQKSELVSGQIVYIPASTVIYGVNESDEETVLIPTWANIGREGPLVVPGKPRQD